MTNCVDTVVKILRDVFPAGSDPGAEPVEPEGYNVDRMGSPAPSALDQKQERLFALLREMGEVMVAYSGGTDSAYLAWAANQTLGPKAVAITADSASIPASHKKDAEDFVRRFGIRHEYIETHEFENPDYVKNDGNRCFHCKDELFTQLAEAGKRLGLETIIYGVNVDDQGDYRPGHKAANQHGVRAPLLEAGMTKQEIRELSRRMDLPTWDRPAAACLSSRIEYGIEVTPERISQVERGEEALKALGFRVYRVRYHGELVRLELGKDELARALDPAMAARFTEIFKSLGFKYVTLDLEGYRQGSFNQALPSVSNESEFRILN